MIYRWINMLGVYKTILLITLSSVLLKTDIQPGLFLKLSVSDTGDGISDDVMDRMFDPYYTTKQKG